MPSPTFVASYPSASFSTATSPKTASVTVSNGDALAIVVVADGPGRTFTPSGGGLTYNQRAIINTANEGMVVIFIAESNSAQSFTLSITDTGGTQWGFQAIRWSNARDAARGASTTVASSNNGYVTLTTLNANSSVVCGISDFNAVAVGASTAWLEDNATAGTQLNYALSSPNYTYGIGYFANAGTAASHTFGLQNNSNVWQAAGVAAAEIKYQAAATGTTELVSPAATAWAGTTAQAIAATVEPGKPAATAWAGTTASTSTTTTVTELGKPAAVSWAGATARTVTSVIMQAGPAAVAWSGAAPGLDIIDTVEGAGPPAVAFAGTTATTLTSVVESGKPAGFAWAGTVATVGVTTPTTETGKPAATAWAGTSGRTVGQGITPAGAAGISWSGTVASSIASRMETVSPAGVAWSGTTVTTAFTTPIVAATGPGGFAWSGTPATTATVDVASVTAAGVAWAGAPVSSRTNLTVTIGSGQVAWAATPARITALAPGRDITVKTGPTVTRYQTGATATRYSSGPVGRPRTSSGPTAT